RANALAGRRHVDFDDYDHRQAMVRALRVHERLGTLRRVDGDPTAWANRHEAADGLYEFRMLAYHILASLDRDAVGRLLTRADPAAEVAVGDGLPPRVRLYRELLLAPALWRADDPEAFAVLLDRHERRRVADELYDLTGWELEMTGSYAALVRANGSSSRYGVLFPGRGVRTDLALLICAAVRDGLSGGESYTTDAEGSVLLTEVQLERLVIALSDRYRGYWGTGLAGSTTGELVRQAVAELRAWDLLRGPDAEGRYRVLPLASRFRGYYPDSPKGVET
ncbi:MAG TPA: DUF2398 family protein, partial [Bacillota bacterium]